MLSAYLAKSLTKPRRHPISKTPLDYGMQYEDISLRSSDDVPLKGWFVPAKEGKKDRLVVVTNPMPFSRYGYSKDHQGLFKITKREVELLKPVKHLHDHGYDVVIIDLRNHGESGVGTGGYCTVGMEEWRDVVALLHWIGDHEDLAEKKMGFFAQCTGANAVIKAMAEESELFENASCLFALQPVSSDVFTKQILKNQYPLFKGLYKGINENVRGATGLYLEDMTPKPYLKHVKVPVIVAQTEKDPWTLKSDIEEMYELLEEPKELLWLPGEERFDGYRYFGDQPEKLLAFFDEYL